MYLCFTGNYVEFFFKIIVTIWGTAGGHVVHVTPLKINMQYYHGGLEDPFPFYILGWFVGEPCNHVNLPGCVIVSCWYFAFLQSWFKKWAPFYLEHPFASSFLELGHGMSPPEARPWLQREDHLFGQWFQGLSCHNQVVDRCGWFLVHVGVYLHRGLFFFLFCCYYQSQVHRSSDECFRTKEFLSLHSLKWKKVLTGNGSTLTLTICSSKDLIVSAAFWIVKGSIVEGISLSSKIRTLPFQFFLNLCVNLPRPICVWTCISNCLRTSYLYEVLCRHPVCLNLLLSLSPLCVLRSWSSFTNLFLLLLYPPCFWKTMLSDNMVFRIGGVHV